VCNIKNTSEALSKEELLNQLKQNNVSCRDVSFKLFGLSLASINTIFSFILSVIFLKLFLNYEKN
jgi:disulfide bond formation protein DsbB